MIGLFVHLGPGLYPYDFSVVLPAWLETLVSSFHITCNGRQPRGCLHLQQQLEMDHPRPAWIKLNRVCSGVDNSARLCGNGVLGIRPLQQNAIAKQ